MRHIPALFISLYAVSITQFEQTSLIIKERRIPFDIEKYIDILIKSDQFIKANVWSKIIIQELRTAREHMFSFLKFAEEYANKIDDKRRPFMLDTWEKAYELWSLHLPISKIGTQSRLSI